MGTNDDPNNSVGQETAGIGALRGKEKEDILVKGILPDSVAAWSQAKAEKCFGNLKKCGEALDQAQYCTILR